MNIGDSIRRSIDEWEAREFESAMLHACNAIDGTAKKMFPTLGSAKRFKKLLRTNFDILGPMGLPAVDLTTTRFIVGIEKPDAPGGGVDVADIVYGVHRCCHAHGDDLPYGFELIPDAVTGPGATSMMASRGKLALSDRILFALLAVAVFAPINVGQVVPETYRLTFGTKHQFDIHRWWGQRDLVANIFAIEIPHRVCLKFDEWVK